MGYIAYFYNQGIIRFRRNYLKRIGAEIPTTTTEPPKINELNEDAILEQELQNEIK